MSIKLSVPQKRELKPRIVVVGVGGAGGNAVNNMIAAGLEGVDFVVANTDAQALTNSKAERRIQMGIEITQGLGAGSDPEIGGIAAEEALPDIIDMLQGAHMVFVTAGMGGGTGTGAAPVIANAARTQIIKGAKERGILTVGVVTKPFEFEGTRRMRSAEAGIAALQKEVDTLIVIPNQNLFGISNAQTTFAEAFAMADEVLHSGVASITDLMINPGLINLDFADVCAVMRSMGKAMMGTGEAEGENRAREAAEVAIANPLLDINSMRGAQGVLINITGGSDMTLHEVEEAATIIKNEVDSEANIIIGSTLDESLSGVLRVSVVATGIEMQNAHASNDGDGNVVTLSTSTSPQSAPQMRTGGGAQAQAMPAIAPLDALPSEMPNAAPNLSATLEPNLSPISFAPPIREAMPEEQPEPEAQELPMEEETPLAAEQEQDSDDDLPSFLRERPAAHTAPPQTHEMPKRSRSFLDKVLGRNIEEEVKAEAEAELKDLEEAEAAEAETSEVETEAQTEAQATPQEDSVVAAFSAPQVSVDVPSYALPAEPASLPPAASLDTKMQADEPSITEPASEQEAEPAYVPPAAIAPETNTPTMTAPIVEAQASQESVEETTAVMETESAPAMDASPAPETSVAETETAREPTPAPTAEAEVEEEISSTTPAVESVEAVAESPAMESAPSVEPSPAPQPMSPTMETTTMEADTGADLQQLDIPAFLRR